MTRAQGRAPLFVDGEFTAHSGATLPFKIECDALTDTDLATLAADIARRFRFSRVVGVPRGGIRLYEALTPYLTRGHGTLIVDDVLTTGRSMEEYRQRFDPAAQGVVIFARGPCPAWITPLFGDVSAARTQGEWAGIEKAVRVIQDGRFLHSDAPVARWAREVVTAIRRACAAPEPQEEKIK